MNASGMRSDMLCSCCSLRSEDAKWLLSDSKYSKFQMTYVGKAGKGAIADVAIVSTGNAIRSLEMETPSFVHLEPPSTKVDDVRRKFRSQTSDNMQ